MVVALLLAMGGQADVSIIVPAYNEERRIAPFLEGLLKFSQENLESYEIVVVNDGSTDGTDEVVKRIIAGREDARLVGYSPNRGKGGAVRFGVLASKGERIIFIDGDGSIQPGRIPAMLAGLKEYDVVVGDRSLRESRTKIPAYRRMTGRAFNFIVDLLFRTGIKDNLCGFKGVRAGVARDLFGGLISRGWVFDVELFYKIRERGYRLHRIPVEWEHRGDSKMTFLAPFKILLELLILRVQLRGSSL